jgi:hypothetical protein
VFHYYSCLLIYSSYALNTYCAIIIKNLLIKELGKLCATSKLGNLGTTSELRSLCATSTD